MVALICFILAVLASPFKSNSRLEAENTVLRHHLIILQRKVRGRAHLTNNDRWFFVQMYRWFPSIMKVVTIIEPETLEIVRRDHPVAYLRTVASLLRPATDPGLITDKYAEMTDAELFDELSSLIESFPPDIRISREKQSGLSATSKIGRSHKD